MELDLTTISVIFGVCMNVAAIIGVYIKIERRLTRLETLMQILIKSKGILLEPADKYKTKHGHGLGI